MVMGWSNSSEPVRRHRRIQFVVAEPQFVAGIGQLTSDWFPAVALKDANGIFQVDGLQIAQVVQSPPRSFGSHWAASSRSWRVIVQRYEDLEFILEALRRFTGGLMPSRNTL